MSNSPEQVAENFTVLATKLYVPQPQPRSIVRRHLVDRLNDGLHRKLTLISAPAGFGKTTLVTHWAVDCERPIAWLALDEADGEPSRFLTYLISAIQTIVPNIANGLVQALQLPQPPPTDTVLTALLNELNILSEEIILVLDDYHLIDSTHVDHAVAFLLEHMPSQFHLVITTREDPQLPLARLRSRNQMTELRASDLRFTADEAAAFLNDVMGLNLSAHDVAALESRTEGWVAGLQLAGLSMQGREDVPSFIHAFAGDDRFVVDYLVEEVLQHQPEHIRTFLLQTSILDRLSGSLCDAVMCRDDSRWILESLERSNLFVVPLDDKRLWYRYHHLFADVLRARAAMEDGPDEVAVRNQRASRWYEANGFRAAAIDHALAAGDFDSAARLIELTASGILGSSMEGTLYGWLTALPDDLVRARPVLSVNYAFALFSRGGLDAAEARLRDAEPWLDAPADRLRDDSPGEMVVVDEAAFRSLPGTIAVARAYRAGALGDVDGIVRYAQSALDSLPAEDDLWRGAAAAVLGIGYWTRGDLEPAYRSFDEGKARLEAAGYMQFQISSVHILADIRIAQGRLNEAERIYRDALRLATEQGGMVWGIADLYVGLSEVHLERNELESATQLLLQSMEMGDHAGLADTRHRWYVAMSRIKEAQGDLDGALDLLDEAERQYVMGADPVVQPIAALRAQVWVSQGRLLDAQRWVRERSLSVHDELTYLREFEHITLARVLIAQYIREREPASITEAVALLKRLLEAAEVGERQGSVIDILVLLAIARDVEGDISLALESLKRALVLASPEGYVRTFVGEGMPMARLLSEAYARRITPDYTGTLLAACDGNMPVNNVVSPTSATGTAQSLIEPLSPREMEVLHLIAQGLSNHQISERLYLALSTVKGHNRAIFGKLQVQRRTEAVARARELGIL